MSANTIMTPGEVQKAAEELNKQIAANELKIVEQVREWFKTEQQTTYDAINQNMANNTAANIENYTMWVDVKTYNPQELPLLSTMTHSRLYDIIWGESYKQCKIIGDFIRAQGHNLTNANTTLHNHWGIRDTTIKCEFTFGLTNQNKKK
jgi:hypothetical protein